MAELADALDSGSNFRKEVEVQILLPAPNKTQLNQKGLTGFVIIDSKTREIVQLSKYGDKSWIDDSAIKWFIKR